MKLKITICVLALAGMLFFLGAAQFTVPLARINAVSASSNIVLVQQAACNNGSTHAAYTCTLITTGSGEYAVIVSQDYNAKPAVPTDSASDTFASLYSQASAHGSGVLTFWGGAISSGVTALTLNTPTSGYSNSVVKVYSGIGASQPDVVSSGLLAGATPTVTSSIALAEQTDLAVSGCVSPSASGGYALLDNWVDGIDSQNSSGSQDLYAGDILNGIRSQFSGNMSLTASGGECAVVTLKSAVAGSAPGGNSPSTLVDFETGSASGTALTQALMNAGSHGRAAGFWKSTSTGNYNGFTLQSGAQMGTLHATTVNGKTYASGEGSLGLQYDMTTSPTNSIYLTLPSPVGTVSTLLDFKTGTDVTDQQDFETIDGGGSDRAQLEIDITSGHFGIECNGTQSTFSFAPLPSTAYIAAMQYVAGGTHTLTLYNASGASLGSVTCAATGTNDVTQIQLGQQHASAGTGVVQFDNLLIDTNTGAMITP